MLQRVQQMKKNVGRALPTTLSRIKLDGITERQIKDAWLAQLQKDETIHASGWYNPPPDGILLAFGSPDDGYERIAQPSFRPEIMWPSDRIFHPDTDIIMAYASPVCCTTNLIGDMGCSLYFGSDKSIHRHFIDVAGMYRDILDYIAPGMTFADIYKHAMRLIKQAGMNNDIESSTDDTGTNIGHTIPLSFISDPVHQTVAQAKTRDDLYKALSAGRIFVNEREEQRVEDNMAFTIEPRLSAPGMPHVYFHITVIIEGGVKRIIHGFSGLDNPCMKDVVKELTP